MPRAIPLSPRPRSGRVRRLGAAAATGLLAGPLLAVLTPATAWADPDDKLGPHHRALLEQYRSQGVDVPEALAAELDEEVSQDEVTLIVATDEDSAPAVAADLQAAGLEVARVEAEVGYLKVRASVDEVDAVESHEQVLRIDVDELIDLPEPEPDSPTTAAAHTAEGPGPDTPDDNPFLPVNEIGAVDFREALPEADGRGVRIGVLDTGVDMAHPALSETTTGEDKIVGWVNSTDPEDLVDLVNDDFFVLMQTVSGPEFTSHGRTWTAPDDGQWRFGLFTYPVAGAEDDAWGVVLRPEDGTILVDLDQNADFTDETPIEDFNETGDFRYFGEDDPDTEISEAHPFVATALDAHGGMVHIGLDHHGHGTHVAGIAAGHSLFGGAMNGAAPGAQIVSSRACYSTQCSTTALVDGMIDLATGHGVDVINMSIGATPALNHGQSARELLYDRLIEATGVQMFISAGNSGPGLNTHGDPAGAANVVSVAAGVSAQTWEANFASPVAFDRGLFPFSSQGPREDGGLKPDLSAPGSAVAPLPIYQPGSPAPTVDYDLAPGYGTLRGTSMAAPQATGGAALLLSAARQHGGDAAPAELRDALSSTADFHTDVAAAAQGHGQVDVPAAWETLQAGAQTHNLAVTAEVCTVQAEQLPLPGQGPGLANRCAPWEGGHEPGERITYEVSVTGDPSATGPERYTVGVQGGEDAFHVTPRSLTIRPGEEASLRVRAEPEAGVHSALVTLDHADTAAVDHTTMLTVLAPHHELDGEPVGFEGVLERNTFDTHLVAVPPGTEEMTVRLSGEAEGSQVRWGAFTPLGVVGEADWGAQLCYTNLGDGQGCDPYERTYSEPVPGVWSLVVENWYSTPDTDNPYALEVTTTSQG
jgi:subtilisin family serine protease